jgi:hypothetical protein
MDIKQGDKVRAVVSPTLVVVGIAGTQAGGVLNVTGIYRVENGQPQGCPPNDSYGVPVTACAVDDTDW